MYLKSTVIKNVQSHKNTVIYWHNGVNVIVGSTDAGKSAIFRAVGWVAKNKINDRGFRSKWGGKADCELVFTDGKEVSRVQDKDNAYYLVDTENNVDEEYKAFKTTIPEDIKAALNLSDINIQSQFDPPFLLADSAGDVAKTLNKVANLSDIDASISNIRKQVLANSREINTVESQIEELKEQAKTFTYLEQMEKDVIQYEKISDGLEMVTGNISNLATVIDRYEQDQKELIEIEAFLKAEPEVTLALTLAEQEKAVISQIQQLQAIVEVVAESQNSLKETETFLEAENDVESALKLVSELNEIQKEGQALTDMINLMWKNEILVKGSNIVIERLETEWKSTFPDVCPLCNQEVKCEK